MRRLGALFDGLIVIAMEMMAAGVVIAVLHALVAMGGFNAAPYADATFSLITQRDLLILCISPSFGSTFVFLDSRRANSV